VSISLTDAFTKTLPIKMLQYVDESPDPAIAALSTLILLATMLLLLAVGLRRLAGLAE
jgi:putative spermidine/putrescine transport system permease protein